MTSSPCLMRFVSGPASSVTVWSPTDGPVPWSLWRAGAGPNTLGAVGFDLNAFFEVTGKDPVEGTVADVFDFLGPPAGDRTVVRLADRSRAVGTDDRPPLLSAACRRWPACTRTWSPGATLRRGSIRCRMACRPGGSAGRGDRGPRRWCGVPRTLLRILSAAEGVGATVMVLPRSTLRGGLQCSRRSGGWWQRAWF